MGGVCNTQEEMSKACKILVAEPGEKRPLYRSKCIRKYNIKMDPTGIWCEGVELI
jgi:hypothetical protein